MVRVGENIKRFRQGKEFTQIDLGLAFNPPKPQSVISRWETGRAVPDVEHLCILADALGVTLDDLAGRGGRSA